ncbi:hypothetical protein [Vibrio pectenicida]|uniref:VCBS repeat-containing protein n=1 Tax=Vibrio pectenicida TaxID=62763 RepID=A0A3R9FKZ2_9VIBR|nr:hypothetical protein [Vibrio pectenicida]RSD30466.1 hypothetical protein EJA03_13810 [Vibrio pectenicida]
MRKSIFALSVTALLSSSLFASDYVVSDPRELLPGEDIKNFSLADLNGDGVNELVFVTVSGQLKYSQLIGLGRGLINEEQFESLKGKRFRMNVSLEGDTYYNTTLVTNHQREISILRSGRYRACAANVRFDNNRVLAKYGDNIRYEFTYISDDFIAGKMMCHNNGIEQTEEIRFTALLE